MDLIEYNVVHFMDEKRIEYILPEDVKISIKTEEGVTWIPIKNLFNKSSLTVAESFDNTTLAVTLINKSKVKIPWNFESDAYVIGNFIFKK